MPCSMNTALRFSIFDKQISSFPKVVEFDHFKIGIMNNLPCSKKFMHKNGRLGYQIFAYEYPHNQVGIFRYGI